MLCAIAFLPPGDVTQGFEELVNEIGNSYNDAVAELLDYLEDNFMGRYRRNAPCRPPLVALDLWKMFNKTDDELPRTNSSVDGWHSTFQAHISSCHLVL